jgi:translation initiation factor eIF-2B subunit delta
MALCLQVADGDVILTFAYSHIVANVLIKAAALGRNFKVMVVDCRPELEGQRMLEVCTHLCQHTALHLMLALQLSASDGGCPTFLCGTGAARVVLNVL